MRCTRMPVVWPLADQLVVGIRARVIMVAAHDNEGAFASQIRRSDDEHCGPPGGA
jgi:hypothetical protein